MMDLPVAKLDDEDGAANPDGDNVHLWVWTSRDDMGWRDVRVLHIDAPDDKIKGPGVSYGVKETTYFTTKWLSEHPRLRVTTRQNDNFGRMLGDIYDADTGEHLDTALIKYCREVLGLDIFYSREGLKS